MCHVAGAEGRHATGINSDDADSSQCPDLTYSVLLTPSGSNHASSISEIILTVVIV